jgi:hypothetical protein
MIRLVRRLLAAGLFVALVPAVHGGSKPRLATDWLAYCRARRLLPGAAEGTIASTGSTTIRMGGPQVMVCNSWRLGS